MKKITLALFAFSIIFYTSVSAQSLLKASGTKIVDASGNEIILRGIGLGGWMLQEGYMLQTADFAPTQHEIRKKIEDLIGSQGTNDFYNKWLTNHVTKTDIDSLAAWGFNSIRLPMHYNLYTLPTHLEPIAGTDTWLETGFQLTDSLLKWCKQNNIYLILDLHAAPGGQGRDRAISDMDENYPSLWQSSENKRKTIALWKKLAEKYANEPAIGGYDLINETNWNFEGAHPNGCNETRNVDLRNLLVDITRAIREVDQNHIIFIEGNCWANNFNGLTPPWDNNLVYSFHKYWNQNSTAAIQQFLDLRTNQNVPIWLGETGENSNVWFQQCVRLLEDNKIGWAWWPVKKIGSIVGPLTAIKTDNYNYLLDYWKGTVSKPATDWATDALMQQADNLKIEKCVYHPDVIDALIRQPFDNTTKPFKKHSVSAAIYFTDYDMGRIGKAYFDKDYQNADGGQWNKGYAYRNDGVDIETCTDRQTNGFSVGWTEANEWLQYTVDVPEAGNYNISVRYAAAASGAKIYIQQYDANISGSFELPSTGNWTTWNTFVSPTFKLSEGKQPIRIYIENGGCNLNYFEITKSTSTGSINQNQNRLFDIYPNPSNNTIHITKKSGLDKNITIKLFNLAGICLLNENFTGNTYKINKSDLIAGNYILYLANNNEIIYKETITFL